MDLQTNNTSESHVSLNKTMPQKKISFVNKDL